MRRRLPRSAEKDRGRQGQGLTALLAGASLLIGLPASALADVPPPTTQLTISFEAIRSSKGMVRACLTREPAFFLRCEHDPASFKASVEARPDAHITFSGVPAGDYALAVLHDENGNAKADRLLGIPREGVGFSRNPALTFGPPSFAAARFHVSGPSMKQDIRIKYFL
jgi:uncharacterized protein (DUF2141 family)